MQPAFCGNCGKQLQPDEMRCSQCGLLRETKNFQESSVLSPAPEGSHDAATALVLPPAPLVDESTVPNRGKKSHRGLWIALSIMSAVLVVLGVGAFLVFANLLSPTQTLPSPTRTLDAFCDALERSEYQATYGQLSNRFQAETSEPLFASFFSQVTSCAHSAPAQSGTRATASLTTTYSSGRTGQDPLILIQESNGSWKIDDDPNLSTPTRTLNKVCTALQQTDYHTAYTQYSSNYQRQQTEQEFADSFSTDRVTSCSNGPITVSGPRATVTAMVVRASGKTTTYLLTLVQESDNSWKIDKGE